MAEATHEEREGQTVLTLHLDTPDRPFPLEVVCDVNGMAKRVLPNADAPQTFVMRWPRDAPPDESATPEKRRPTTAPGIYRVTWWGDGWKLAEDEFELR